MAEGIPTGYVELAFASTALTDADAKISAAAARRRARGALAPPLAAAVRAGHAQSISLRLTYRGGSEPWIEVEYAHGRCFILGTGSVLDLMNRLREGGFVLAPAKQKTSRRRRPKRDALGSYEPREPDSD